MSQVIVYQIIGQPMAIMTPCECGLTIMEIGKKDVPQGVPFWIIDDSSIPEDRTYRDAWQLDTGKMGAPSSMGGTYKPAEQTA